MRSLFKRRSVLLIVGLLTWAGCAQVFARQAPATPTGVVVTAKPAQPTIKNLSPSSGIIGSTVTITGSGFATTQGTGTVTFNGTAATASVWSALSITVTVPSGATTGNVVVTQNGLVSGGSSFTVSSGACDQTLSAGADVDAAVAAVANGTTWTICLNTATYGSTQVNFTNISRTSGYITIKEAAGQTATLTSPVFSNSDFIKVEGLTLSGTFVTNCSTNIQILSSTYINVGPQFYNFGITCTNYPANLLFDGNTVANVIPPNSEGIVEAADNSGNGFWGLTFSNNIIGPATDVDGFQFSGVVVGITVGPGNIIQGIVAGPKGVHSDGIQMFGGGSQNVVNGNWFRNNDTAITHHTSTPTGTVWTNNVFSNNVDIQIGATAVGDRFEHNTVYALAGPFFTCRLSSNCIFRSNINLGPVGMNVAEGCSNCTFSFNLCPDPGDCNDTSNEINATPIFVGGADPALFDTFSDWQLATGSPGENNGHDGQDRGTTYYGP